MGWQQSPWLKGELVLILDESMTAQIAGHGVGYDSVKGLTVAKEESDA